MRGRPGKRRSSAKKSAKKSTKSKAARSRAGRTRKATKPAAKKKTARKSAAPRKAAAPRRKKSAARKTRKTTRTRQPAAREVFGEGNYTASREFRRKETDFVRRNRNKIPAMGDAAEAALEGEEHDELEEAEDRARAHSHSPGDER
ncbi:MAG: hypothetical protein ACREHV_03140 [Rhizomicrobium sp.]